MNSCLNVNCKDTNHCEVVDRFITQILDALELSVSKILPYNTPPAFRKKALPGWSKEVKHFRDKALFWTQVWKSAGKHNIMKRSSNTYNYHLKKFLNLKN